MDPAAVGTIAGVIASIVVAVIGAVLAARRNLPQLDAKVDAATDRLTRTLSEQVDALTVELAATKQRLTETVNELALSRREVRELRRVQSEDAEEFRVYRRGHP